MRETEKPDGFGGLQIAAVVQNDAELVEHVAELRTDVVADGLDELGELVGEIVEERGKLA